MEIRLLEPVPRFEAGFFVDEGYPGVERLLRDLCGLSADSAHTRSVPR
jgi:hypothetical protein